MRCTSCTNEIKPIVALDIDGTLGEFHPHFLEFLVGYTGGGPWLGDYLDDADYSERYNGVGSFRDWCCQAYRIDERTWYDAKLAYRQGGLKRTMPAVHGAKSLSQYLRVQGAEIWITTTRPHNRLDNIDPDTQEWLRRNEIVYDYAIYDDDKYSLLCEMVDAKRVVAVLDDQYDQIIRATEVFGPHVPIHMQHEWNGGQYGATSFVVNELVIEAKREIGHRLMLWNRKHRDIEVA